MSGSDSENFESADEESVETPIKNKKNISTKKTEKSADDTVENTDGWGDWGEEDFEPIASIVNEDKITVVQDKPIVGEDKHFNCNIINVEKSSKIIPVVSNSEEISAAPQKSSKTQMNIISPINLELEAKLVTTPTSDSSPNNLVPEPKSTITTSNSWGWGGISSFSSMLSSGVSTITNAIGIPEPEELVQIDKRHKEEINISHDFPQNDNRIKEDTFLPNFTNLVSGVTNIGSKVITGGLDTLEGIGKKTMNMLQENDPLLLNKRKMIGLESDKPVLSQILREAKEKSEEMERNLKQIQKKSYKKQIHFETLFDFYYGLVHLEALEMLSKQSAIKLQTLLDPLSGKALTDLNETLTEVSELCDISDVDCDTDDSLTCEELKLKLDAAAVDLEVQINFQEIYSCWTQNLNYLNNDCSTIPQDIYEKALRCLAETCALQITKMHKIAEMVLIKEHHRTIYEADNLTQMTTIFCQHLKGVAIKYVEKLNEFEQTEEVKQLITNIFLEVCNSVLYIQSAFKLFVPILQLGAV